jgi:hypothetical protein
MPIRTAFIPLIAMLFLSVGAAAQDGIGRYQAVPIAPAPNSANSGEILLLDTRDGHVWKWWEAPTVGSAVGGSGITYMGKLTPGTSPGEIIQRFKYGQPSGQ